MITYNKIGHFGRLAWYLYEKRMTNNPGIYKITSPKNKIYIGQSRNVRKRINLLNAIVNYMHLW